MKYFVNVVDEYGFIPVAYCESYSEALLKVLEVRRWYKPRMFWHPKGIRIEIRRFPMTKERRRIQYQICEALKAADYDKARLYIHLLGLYDEANKALPA